MGHLGVRLQPDATLGSPTSTGHSACPVSASNAGSAEISWSRRTPPRSHCCDARRKHCATCVVSRSSAQRGRYGFYEAIDFTPERLPATQPFAVVRAYMAHHQGMSLVAIGNVLTDGAMCERFHFEPRIRAAELLLQERCTQHLAARTFGAGAVTARGSRRTLGRRGAHPVAAAGQRARVHLLSNRRYAVMLTGSGGGYSACDDMAVTRLRPDLTTRCQRLLLLLRDVASGAIWSAALPAARRRARLLPGAVPR